jgi:hypothetical protein
MEKKFYTMKFPGGETAVVEASDAGNAYEALKSAFMKSGYSEFCITPDITDVYSVTEILPAAGEVLVIQRVKL